jgi:hypothetical protein
VTEEKSTNNHDDISQFLKNMGMKDEKKPEAAPVDDQWDRIITPSSSYLLTGDVGTGKTGLAFWLLEKFSAKHNFKPAVVGFQRPDLLPANYLSLDLDDLAQTRDTIALIDEADIQLPIEDSKARETVTNFLSLPRQRHQIFILSFHYPRLVLSRYLPFFAAFLFKRPPYLIEFASKSKNDSLTKMMYKAEERFLELVPPNWQPAEGQTQPVEVIRNTYVVAPRIRWQGLITNPTATFWTQAISESWSGTEIEQEPKGKKRSAGIQLNFDPEHLVSTDGKTEVTPEMRKRGVRMEKLDREPPNQVFTDPFTNVTWVE